MNGSFCRFNSSWNFKITEDPSYGGGFLLKDILEGKDIDVKVEAINGDIIESTTNIDEITRAQMIGTRGI